MFLMQNIGRIDAYERNNLREICFLYSILKSLCKNVKITTFLIWGQKEGKPKRWLITLIAHWNEPTQGLYSHTWFWMYHLDTLLSRLNKKPTRKSKNTIKTNQNPKKINKTQENPKIFHFLLSFGFPGQNSILLTLLDKKCTKFLSFL